MSLYLCVDCGGSKTSAVISSASGEIIGRALGGPSNFAYLTIEAFTQAVKDAVSKALSKTSVDPPVSLPPPEGTNLFASVWFGISGVDSPSAVASATNAISNLLGVPKGPKLVVANDTHLLAAPLRLHPDIDHAVTVICGTGSICVSFEQTSEGALRELGRIGGWGWILGDEGGGFHVGREAVRQLLIDSDEASLGGAELPRSVLKERILEHFRVQSAMELLTVVHLPDPTPTAPNANAAATTTTHPIVVREKRLSELCPLVFTSAFKDEDAFALRILQLSSKAMAQQIHILLRSPSGSEYGPKSVVASESVICFGGSLVGIKEYRDMILGWLKDESLGGGHVFKYVEYVDDAARVGAEGLAAAAAAAARGGAVEES